MATGEQDAAEEGAPETGETPAAAKPNRKKLFIIVAAALLLGGGGAGAWFAFGSGGGEHAEAKEEPLAVTAEELVDVPPMTVNLRTPDGVTRMLRVHVMLVPGEGRKEEVAARLPLVIDRYQPFLRELRPEDVSGSAATFRLKEEMMIRSNAVLGAGAVRDVLIQDLVQQ